VCSGQIPGFPSGAGAPYCADGNAWFEFGALNAGTYHYPVRASQVSGPYELHVHAEALPPLNPGPDDVTGDIASLDQLGREGNVGEGIVGLGVSSEDCNVGDVGILVLPLPDVRHRLIEANLYRLSGFSGATRFEQIGQSWLKHTYGPSLGNVCGLGCRPFDCGNPNDDLCPGCSDAYSAIQFAPCDLGPRSAVHPFTVAMPGGDNLGEGGSCPGNFPANNHIGHDHPHTDIFDYFGIKHRLQVRDVDLDPTMNPGARYFAEVAYLTPDEYLLHNGNQNNNVSHREFSVSGPDQDGVFVFTPLFDTVRESPAIDAWPGAAQSLIEPYPLEDGRAFVVYQVTDLGAGLWHYEYAIYNMNLDAAVGSLRIPVASSVRVSNVGFHAPLAHAPEPNADDYSTAPWTVTRAGGNLTFATDDFSADPLANAIRYGTAYNFRFDADTAPTPATAPVGIFKTADTALVPVLGPSAPIPAASRWGLASLALLLLNAGSIVLRRW
jgi:hypothetical protein